MPPSDMLDNALSRRRRGAPGKGRALLALVGRQRPLSRLP